MWSSEFAGVQAVLQGNQRTTEPTTQNHQNRIPISGCCSGHLIEVSYILVAGDYPNQEAVTVARKLVDQMFCRFSPQLHSDQGKQFESRG